MTEVKEKKTVKKKASKKSSKTRVTARGKTLIIVESPAKARTINKYLGNKYIIEASMGHIIDLPRSRMAVDVKNNFTPEYITVRGRAKILNRLKKLASSSSRVLLAADPDREGEAISWHLGRVLSAYNQDIKRIEFNEITKAAVEQAVLSPREINMDLVNAQQARRILDRLVGYNISPLLWKKIKRGLSAGRVQSIALRMVCEREDDIEKFNPEEYWSLDVNLMKGKSSFHATLNSVDGKKPELKSENDVTVILAKIKDQPFSVTAASLKERKRQPTAPYITSKLQQDAANKLGFTSQKTMMIAQQLYEGLEAGEGVVTGLITYMRTDSTRISPVALDRLRDFIKERLGEKFLSPEAKIYKTAKSAQDAHECIRPTDPYRSPEDIQSHLSKDQFRLYQMIWQKFVSCQMSDEIADHTSVDITSNGCIFRATGRTVTFTGFTEVFNPEDKKKKDNVLPELKEGDEVILKETDPQQHFTQPPPRYTDASMVKILEESGVGRPSTYSPTITTLLKRFYATRLQRALKPTDLGRLVNEVMKENFFKLLDVNFTAQMEEDLDRIANHDMDWVAMLETFYQPFIETVEHAQEHVHEMKNVLDEPTDYVCEKCGRKMVKKIGRHGYFLACPGFPECRNAKAIPLGKCPTCETGDVIQRATKRGRPFFGCSRYPECEFSTWDKPVKDQICPKCNKLLLEKSSREKGRYIACSSCDYEEAEQSA